MKRFALLTVGVLLVAAAALAVLRTSPSAQDALFARAAKAQLARQSQVPQDEDALHVLLCGTSSPLPLRSAAKACALVIAGGQLLLFDIGPEATENLALWRVPAPQIARVFLTHFHSDHIGELGEFNMQGWAQGRRQPLQVHGPEGVQQVVAGFNAAYAADRQYRNAHHDRGRGLLPLAAGEMQAVPIAGVMPAEPPAGRQVLIHAQDGVRVTAVETDHRPVSPAFSYRVDYRGRSVVITGDTVYYPPLAEAARGADVLISEAQAHHLQRAFAEQAALAGNATLADVLHDTTDYHISPVEAAELANAAGVRELVFTHLAPPAIYRFVRWTWLRGVAAVRPEGVRIGHDGMLISIPLDGGPIRFSTLRG